MSNDIATTGSNGVPATTTTSKRIAERRRLTAVAVTFFSIEQGEHSEIHLAYELHHIERCDRPDSIRNTIDKGEAMLAAYRSSIDDLHAALVPATLKDIAVEVYDLMLAFPGKDDRAEFTSLLFEHIALEHPSRIVLAAACHRLRCTSKFRPAISEVLEQLAEVGSSFRYLKLFVNLEANLDKARAHLAKIETKLIQGPQPQASSGRHNTRADYLRQTELHRQKEEARALARREAAATVEFMKTTDPTTTECSDETKAANQ
jgi:hypothetical protein